MDDIFYLNDNKITISEIEQTIKSEKIYKIISVPASKVLQVYLNENVFIDIQEMSLSDFGEECATVIEEQKIISVFCFSHHPKDFELLKPILILMLNKHGGWIGNDNENFEPMFDSRNICSFEYS